MSELMMSGPGQQPLPLVPATAATPARHKRGRYAARAVLGLGLAASFLWLAGAASGNGPVGAALLAFGGCAMWGLGAALRTIHPAADPGVWLSGLWLVGLAVAAAGADLLPLGNASDTTQTIGVAGYATPDLFSSHPLGTNGFGLDILARCVYGARVSLATVALTVVISMVVGGLVGMVAGYFRGWVDTVIGIFAEASLVIPALVLLIAVATVLGAPETPFEAVWKSSLALALVGIPTMLRLARANTMLFSQRDFVRASRTLGARHRRVIFRELMPNVVLPLLSYAFVVSAVLIVAEGSLAFLGLGLSQPEPTWGNMIAEGGMRDLRRHPHVPLIPGIFMFLTVFSLNVLGERARSRWDPTRS